MPKSSIAMRMPNARRAQAGPPADAVNYLLAIGRRLDLQVDVSGYGGGKISIALTA